MTKFATDFTPDAAQPGSTMMIQFFDDGEASEYDDETNNYGHANGSTSFIPVTFTNHPKKSFSFGPKDFLAVNGSKEKSEWYIPFVVDELVREGKADCCVLPTDSSWFGVTYRDDKPFVMDSIKRLVDAGEYPARLF